METTSTNEAKHESRNPAQRAVIARFNRELVRLVERVAPRSILDVGCGEGYTLAALGAAGVTAELFGVDLSRSAIAKARRRLPAGVTLTVGDARELHAGRARFDLVIMTEVLEHLDEPGDMLPVLAGLSRGRVLLSVPWEPFFRGINFLRGKHVTRLGNHPEHVQCWSRTGFIRFVERHFIVEAAPFAFPWTLVLARPKGGLQ